MRTYDPIAESTRLGITVRIDDLPFGDSWWIPEQRVIAVDESVSEPGRSAWIAHQLAHAMLDTPHGHPRAQVEVDASRLASRHVIKLGALAEAIRYDSDPHTIAHRLGTIPEMVFARVQFLYPGERNLIGDLVDEVAWERMEMNRGYECVQYRSDQPCISTAVPARFQWQLASLKSAG